MEQSGLVRQDGIGKARIVMEAQDWIGRRGAENHVCRGAVVIGLGMDRQERCRTPRKGLLGTRLERQERIGLERNECRGEDRRGAAG